MAVSRRSATQNTGAATKAPKRGKAGAKGSPSSAAGSNPSPRAHDQKQAGGKVSHGPHKPAKAGSIPAPATPLTPWQQWSADPDAAIAELCHHIVDGGNAGDFVRARGINYPTLLQWLDQDPKRAELYARAREDRSDKLADEIVSISDEKEATAKLDGNGELVGVVFDSAAIQRNKLRVDARKWVAAKLKPRVYGDKLDLTAQVTIRDLPDEQLLERAAKLQAILAGKGGAA